MQYKPPVAFTHAVCNRIYGELNRSNRQQEQSLALPVSHYQALLDLLVIVSHVL